MEITEDQILRFARLARLDLTADEVGQLAHDISELLNHFNLLSEITEDQGSDATSQPVTESASRADDPTPSLDRAALLARAPEADGEHFVVPKVIG